MKKVLSLLITLFVFALSFVGNIFAKAKPENVSTHKLSDSEILLSKEKKRGMENARLKVENLETADDTVRGARDWGKRSADENPTVETLKLGNLEQAEK